MKFLMEFNTGKYEYAEGFVEMILDEGYKMKRLYMNADLIPINKSEALAQAKHQDIMLVIQPR